MKRTDYIDLSDGTQPFVGLVPSFAETMGEEYMTGKREGATDYLEVVDNVKVMDYVATLPTPEYEGQFVSFDGVVTEIAVEGEKPEPGPEPGPEPEPEVESDSYYCVRDEASWNEAYDGGNGPLAKYYEKYPEEDLWNTKENRAVNFNDRHYVGTIDGEEVECGATWESEQAQSVVINGEKYYTAIFYDMEPRECPLFTDVKLENSADKTLVLTSISFSEDCQHCWMGTVKAPGAKLPWIIPHFDEPVHAHIRFEYEGKEAIHPWSNTELTWGIASVAAEWKAKELLITENATNWNVPESQAEGWTGEEGANSFDTAKFKMILEMIG